jgi:hypothetical protein
MAGLIEEFGIDLTDISETPSYDIPDGEYDFVIGDAYSLEGTKNHPDTSYLIIKFLLGEDGKEKNEWYPLPADAANLTTSDIATLGRYKARLISLGIAPEMTSQAGPDELVGINGHLTLLSTTNAKGTHQNIRNIELAGAEAPAAPAAEAAAPPKVARAPRAAAAPKVPTSAPAGAAGTVKVNPFA